MSYTPRDILEYIKQENLEIEFLTSMTSHVQGFTIAELTDVSFQQREGKYYVLSKTYSIDVPLADEQILTAVMNGLYVSVFISRYEEQYQLHFLVHQYPKTMKSQFDDEIAKEVIDYMILKTVVQLRLDTPDKIKEYIK